MKPLIAILLLLIVGGAYYWYATTMPVAETNNDTAVVTEEAAGDVSDETMPPEAMSAVSESDVVMENVVDDTLIPPREMTTEEAAIEAAQIRAEAAATSEASQIQAESSAVNEVEDDSNEVTFEVSGFNYGYNLEEIVVNEGDTVTINFVSTDGFHDWVVDEFDAATAKVRPGDAVTSVTFVADKTGTFEYYCSVGSHRAQGMVGNLVVQ